MNDKLPDEHAILRVMARPNDVNVTGDIFGGWLMSQCDIAGGIVAGRRAGGRVVWPSGTFVLLLPSWSVISSAFMPMLSGWAPVQSPLLLMSILNADNQVRNRYSK